MFFFRMQQEMSANSKSTAREFKVISGEKKIQHNSSVSIISKTDILEHIYFIT